MDTRAVIRSRRQSARLRKQPRDDKAAKQSMPNRRVSDTKVSRTKSVTPKHATPEPTTSKAATIKRARSTAEAAPNGALEPTIKVNSSVKKGERVANSPMFPSLPPTKAKSLDVDNIHQESDIALSRKPSAEATDQSSTKSRGGRFGARWIKTEQGAMRLVYDTPHDISRGAKSHAEKTLNGEASSLPDNLRRSVRLAGNTPRFEDMKTPVNNDDPKNTQHFTPENEDVAPLTPLKGGPAVEFQDPPRRVLSGVSLDPSLTDLGELPPRNNLPFAVGPYEEVDFVEKTSPIPELVTDTARIIETSSPTAARAYPSNTSSIAISTILSTVDTIATTVLAPESAHATHSSTETIDGAVDEADHNSSLAQPPIVDPMLLDSTSGETPLGKDIPTVFERIASLSPAATPDNFTAIRGQRDGPRGIKRPAEAIIDEEQDPMPHQNLATSDRPFLVRTPTRTGNLIESASSRDYYSVEDDELGSPGAGLWLGGETGEAARASGIQEEPHLHDMIKCGDCGKTPQKFIVCARCLKACYCGKYCQMWNWPIHRQVCDVSEEANLGDVKRQEEYMEGAWAGALQVLKDNSGNRKNDVGENKGEQAALQAILDSSFMGHGVGENIVEQGIGLLGGGGGVTGEDGAEQESDERMEGSVMADQNVGDNVQDKEYAVFKMPPPSPESMFRSRAMALRLAQAAEV